MLACPWREIELTLTAERDYPNPYTKSRCGPSSPTTRGSRCAAWPSGMAGAPALLVADTAWALPWRATEQQFSGSPL